MRFPSKETIEQYRREYPVGCRVELVSMDDFQAPPIGTRGTVRGVDDIGNLLVRWDNGSGLNLVIGEDHFRKLDSVITVCYGERQTWDSRKDAADYFLAAMAGSEGSEQNRYAKVYTEIICGFSICTDTEEQSETK